MTDIKSYRPDIDGLRAFAVISVLIFHAFPDVLPGGFVGVDIFFVISGYLITGILLKEADSARINLLGFYGRRIRRIFPALILVLASCFLIGWSILLPSEFVQLSKQIIASASFTINIVLWKEIGYFNNAAITKPLLHLWSLGVEEQFYIVWPILLVFIRKLSRSVLPFVLLLLVISFGTNIIQTRIDQTGAFFLPVSRGWELLAGAALAAIKIENARLSNSIRALFAFFGVALLALSVSRIGETDFPGWLALLPVLGSSLMICAGQHNPLSRLVFSSRFVSYLGRISYPLYLWHWPLLSFARISTQDDISVGRALAILCFSLILAGLTHALLESRISKLKPNVALCGSIISGMFVVASLAGITLKTDGNWSRIASTSRLDLGFDGGWPASARRCSFMSMKEDELLTCYVDGLEKPRFAMIGDSKAGALLNGVFRTSSPGGRWVFFGSGGGGPLLAISTKDPSYGWYNKKLPEIAYHYVEGMNDIDTVVIVAATRALFHIKQDNSLKTLSSTPYYKNALSAFDGYVEKFVRTGKRVLLVADNPTLPHIEDCVDRMIGRWWILGSGPNIGCDLALSEHINQTAPYRKMLNEIVARHEGAVSVFYTDTALCDHSANKCPLFLKGRPLYGVTDHISDYASTIVGSQINHILADRRRAESPRAAN